MRPQEILLVVDAMTGQDAVTVAEAFDGAGRRLRYHKADGDSCGAALRSRPLPAPIKTPQRARSNDLEPFHPDRMASRYRHGMCSLIEKAQAEMDEKRQKSCKR